VIANAAIQINLPPPCQAGVDQGGTDAREVK
jgi:hypothetical protein